MFLDPRVSRVNFTPNSYPPNSLISEIMEIRELLFVRHSVLATVKGASFQQFKI
jgi:hypothetical protein